MNNPSRIRQSLVALTFLTMAAAMTLANGVPPDLAAYLWGTLPMALGAGLAQWILFPLFARRPGRLGLAQDAALFVAVMALGGMLAGTAVIPGAGTLLGPLVTLSLPLQSPLAALVYLLGGALVIRACRRARSANLLQPAK